MRKREKMLALGIMLTMMLVFTGTASADSASSLLGDNDVDLDFEIIIPTVIYFRVGNPAAGVVDTITLQDDNTDLLDGSGFTGSIAVELISTAGDVNITANISSDLTRTTAPIATIPFSDIAVTSTNIQAPPLINGSSVNSSVGGTVINETDTWNFAYTVPATPPPEGIYEGTVTYTVSTP